MAFSIKPCNYYYDQWLCLLINKAMGSDADLFINKSMSYSIGVLHTPGFKGRLFLVNFTEQFQMIEWKGGLQKIRSHAISISSLNPLLPPPSVPLRGSKCWEAEAGISIMLPLWLSVTWSESSWSQVCIGSFLVPAGYCSWWTQGSCTQHSNVST